MAARTRGKSATYGLPAFFESENALVGPGFCAHEEERFVRQAQALRKGPGNQGCLVVSALSLALAVEGNRHDDVDRESVALAAHDFRKLFSKPATQRLDLLELEQENCPDQWSLIDREAAGAIKAVCLVLTSGAEPLSFFQLQPRKRVPANVAGGRWDAFERSEAFRTDRHGPGIQEQFAADAAIGGKDYADERVARSGEPGAQTLAKSSSFAWGALNGGDCARSACIRHGSGMYNVPVAN